MNHTLLTPLFVLTYVLKHRQLLWKTHGEKNCIYFGKCLASEHVRDGQSGDVGHLAIQNRNVPIWAPFQNVRAVLKCIDLWMDAWIILFSVGAQTNANDPCTCSSQSSIHLARKKIPTFTTTRANRQSIHHSLLMVVKQAGSRVALYCTHAEKDDSRKPHSIGLSF